MTMPAWLTTGAAAPATDGSVPGASSLASSRQSPPRDASSRDLSGSPRRRRFSSRSPTPDNDRRRRHSSRSRSRDRDDRDAYRSGAPLPAGSSSSASSASSSSSSLPRSLLGFSSAAPAPPATTTSGSSRFSALTGFTGFSPAPASGGAAATYAAPAVAAAPAASAAAIDVNALVAAALANASQGLGAAGSAAASAATKWARRLYIGGLPRVTETELTAHFNAVISRCYAPGDHILAAYCNHDKKFGFLEFKSVEMTTACLALDGMFMAGSQLRVRRPNDFNHSAPLPVTGPPIVLRTGELGVVGHTVPDGPNKVFIGGLPYNLTDADVMELLQAFGPLKAFHLVREAGAVNSKGYAFAEWQDPAVTDAACSGLDKLPLGDKTLTVRRAMPQNTAQALAASGVQLNAAPPAAATLALAAGGAAAAARLPMGMGALGGAGTGMMAAYGAAFPGAGAASTGMLGAYGGGAALAAPSAVAAAAAAAAAGLLGSMAPPPPPPPPPPMPQAPLPPMPSTTAAAAPLPPSTAPAAPTPSGSGGPHGPVRLATPILRMTNMVTPEDVATEEDYAGLRDEIGDELNRYGQLVALVIPRAGPLLGQVYAQFATPAHAAAAAKVVAGRIFAGKTIAVEYEDALPVV